MSVIKILCEGTSVDIPWYWIERSGYFKMLYKHARDDIIRTDVCLYDLVLALAILTFAEYPSVQQTELRPKNFINCSALCDFFAIGSVKEDKSNEKLELIKSFMRQYINDDSLIPNMVENDSQKDMEGDDMEGDDMEGDDDDISDDDDSDLSGYGTPSFGVGENDNDDYY